MRSQRHGGVAAKWSVCSHTNTQTTRVFSTHERKEVVEGGKERAQDSRSMKPRFRNASLVLTHVLDSCVKLLTVLKTCGRHHGAPRHKVTDHLTSIICSVIEDMALLGGGLLVDLLDLMVCAL